MKVYELDFVHETYQHITPVTDEDMEKIAWMFGEPVGTWEPMLMRVVPETAGRLTSDFPHLTASLPAVSERAAEVLRPLIADHVEFLPLICPDGTYYALNVITEVDALDEEHSDLVHDKYGNLAKIRRYQFVPDKCQGIPVFRIPQDVIPFVTAPFVEAVEKAELTGFRFVLVWES